jgi:hypothetical protein
MFNNLQYQRLIASDRQQILLRQAGASRLRSPVRHKRERARSGPDR